MWIGIYNECKILFWQFDERREIQYKIGFIVDTAEVEGETNPIVVTLNPTVKEFANRKTDKKQYVAFDFAGAKAEYETYVADKATKDAEKAKAKYNRLLKLVKLYED